MKVDVDIKKGVTFYEDKTFEEVQKIADEFNKKQREKLKEE